MRNRYWTWIDTMWERMERENPTQTILLPGERMPARRFFVQPARPRVKSAPRGSNWDSDPMKQFKLFTRDYP